MALQAVVLPSESSAPCSTWASVKVATGKAVMCRRKSALVVDLCTSSDFVVNRFGSKQATSFYNIEQVGESQGSR